MNSVVFAIVYFSLFTFIVACVVRAVRYAKQPVHLRWELYPVPHEPARHLDHGGSYFEDTDWWTKPREVDHVSELRAMVQEMVFLKGLWEFNRPLWFRSFAFHFGLYLLIGTAGLLVAAIAFPALHYLYAATGFLGGVLAMIGAIGLLIRRLSDARLKNYTAPGDIFNLLFFIVTLAVLGAGYVSGAPDVRAIVRGLLTFDTAVPVPGLFAAGMILGALLVAYIPLTHMSHFIAKYFLYHSIRWDDTPNVAGGTIGKEIAKYLAYKPTWSAAHIGADGKKTWVDVAMANPSQGVKK
jgi:nitrate reductase gamma subunit